MAFYLARPMSGRHSIRTNQCLPSPSPIFLQAGCPSCRPPTGVKALKATSAFGLGRRRQTSPQRCYLHRLRTPASNEVESLWFLNFHHNSELAGNREFWTERLAATMAVWPNPVRSCASSVCPFFLGCFYAAYGTGKLFCRALSRVSTSATLLWPELID